MHAHICAHSTAVITYTYSFTLPRNPSKHARKGSCGIFMEVYLLMDIRDRPGSYTVLMSAQYPIAGVLNWQIRKQTSGNPLFPYIQLLLWTKIVA